MMIWLLYNTWISATLNEKSTHWLLQNISVKSHLKEINTLWADYTQRACSTIRVQFNNAFRAVLRLPRFRSASGMFAVARTDCFHATIRKRCASLVRRVRASSNTVLAMIANRLDCPYIRHCCNKHLSLINLTVTGMV